MGGEGGVEGFTERFWIVGVLIFATPSDEMRDEQRRQCAADEEGAALRSEHDVTRREGREKGGEDGPHGRVTYRGSPAGQGWVSREWGPDHG